MSHYTDAEIAEMARSFDYHVHKEKYESDAFYFRRYRKLKRQIAEAEGTPDPKKLKLLMRRKKDMQNMAFRLKSSVFEYLVLDADLCARVMDAAGYY